VLTELAAAKIRLAARPPAVVERPGLMETAVALILTPGERGLEALFIRRAERADDPWSGHIALPGSPATRTAWPPRCARRARRWASSCPRTRCSARSTTCTR